ALRLASFSRWLLSFVFVVVCSFLSFSASASPVFCPLSLHDALPISDLEFLDVRHGVIAIARELERRLPDLVTTAWWKEERGEKIFVDFNQACRDRTIASAYSPRPLEGAPVSMPVRWADLEEIAMADFTVHTVPGLLDSDGDAWAGIGESRGDLSPALRMWQEDLDRGLGELPFPPEYPKMPGEPPRVQPSKRRMTE